VMAGRRRHGIQRVAILCVGIGNPSPSSKLSTATEQCPLPIQFQPPGGEPAVPETDPPLPTQNQTLTLCCHRPLLPDQESLR
jgi:hypothetical protein